MLRGFGPHPQGAAAPSRIFAGSHQGLVRDLMPTLFDLLSEEDEPAVRTVLGHFLFVFILLGSWER